MLKMNVIQIKTKIQIFLYVGFVVSSYKELIIKTIGKIYKSKNSKYFRILNFDNVLKNFGIFFPIKNNFPLNQKKQNITSSTISESLFSIIQFFIISKVIFLFLFGFLSLENSTQLVYRSNKYRPYLP